MILTSYMMLFFFFSSRRRHTRCALVTGVQTCALPILPVYAVHTVVDQAVKAADSQHRMRTYKALLNGVLRGFIRERSAILAQAGENPEAVRSAERRVGNEWVRTCRSRWAPYP